MSTRVDVRVHGEQPGLLRKCQVIYFSQLLLHFSLPQDHA